MLKVLKKTYERHGRKLRHPGFWLVGSYHFGRWAWTLPWPATRMASFAYGIMLTTSEFVLGSTLHRETEIGADLHVMHADGVRIDPAAVLGDRVGIMQSVTIGTNPDRPGAPVIGNDVFIGAGAKILGPVTIGDRARIAANSLVVSDVPPDSTAIGVPAKVMRYTGRPNAGADNAAAAPSGGVPTVAAIKAERPGPH
jgi:serine O-acetyltransferase